MNKELIMKSDALDILFENRNKAYGAYDLRKFYADRLKKALVIMMTLVTGLALFLLLFPNASTLINGTYIAKDVTLSQAEMKPPVEPVKKQEAKPQAKTTLQPQQQFISSFLFVDKKDKGDSFQVIKETVAIGSINFTDPSSGTPVVQPLNTGTGQAVDVTPPKIDNTIPISNPEQMPSYPGGIDALRKFLQRNLQNPKDMEAGESVMVEVRFVVGFNGKLQSFVTVKDGGEEFNKEVVRVLKKMPDWIPGKANGENVAVYYTIPVKFVPAD